jgi:hypoxanthine phosphoribosyltransferase
VVHPREAAPDGDWLRLILNEDQIRSGVRRLADAVTSDYAGRPLSIIGVLTGSVVLLADLIRLITIPLRVGFVQARSYQGARTSPGKLVVYPDFVPDVTGRDVLLVDDIFDTGHTLFELVAHLDELRPKSIKIAVLLRKQGRQRVALVPDYVAFDIPNEFVVGYGLDYNDAYRNLPYVAVLDQGDLANGGGLADGGPE